MGTFFIEPTKWINCKVDPGSENGQNTAKVLMVLPPCWLNNKNKNNNDDNDDNDDNYCNDNDDSDETSADTNQ